MANLMSSGVGDRLIDNHYLHSNTLNFLEITKQHKLSLKNNPDQKLFLQVKKRLESFLIQTNKQMNIFYDDLSQYYISIGMPHKAIISRDSYVNGEYNPAGANEFSRKFLIDNFKSKNNDKTEEQTILSIINSPESISKIREIYAYVFNNFKNKEIILDKEQAKIIQGLEQNFNIPLFNTTKEITYDLLTEYLNNLFIKNKGTGFGLNIRTTKKRKITHMSKDLEKMIKELGIENFNPRRKNSLSELKNLLKQKLIDKELYYLIGLEYWKYLNKEFLKRTGKSLHGAKSQKFARFFSETMFGYKNMNLTEMSQEQSLKGFVLEFGLFASTNLPLKYTQNLTKILGQELVEREYLNEKLTQNSSPISTSTIRRGASASDIEYYGKSGRTYRFQLKNNFNEMQPNLSFRAQATIKVSTYMATALKDAPQDVKDVLTYFLINAAYLRDYGLGPYGKNQQIKFSPKTYKIATEYILFFLQQSYQFLVGYQYDKEYRQKDGITAGNLAYIFQGKYLIPVAAYFYSSLEMLNKLIDNEYILKGIGGIAGLPIMSNNELSINNTMFQSEKIKIISKEAKKGKLTGVYKYPEKLVDYGGKKGIEIYNKISFERISINLTMKRLDEFFKR